MKKMFAALFSLAIGMGATASAQDVISNQNGLVPNVAFEHIAPVLQEAGFTTKRETIGDDTVLVVRQSGKQLVLFEKACGAGGGCGGLWMFAYINDSKPMELISAFNGVSKPARASLVNGKVVLDRYLIADYGTTRGSLVVNASVMVGMVDQWFQYSKQNGPVAVSFTPLMGKTATPSESNHAEIDFLRAMVDTPSLMNIDTSHEGQIN